jgi:hypothetical protein
MGLILHTFWDIKIIRTIQFTDIHLKQQIVKQESVRCLVNLLSQRKITIYRGIDLSTVLHQLQC